jgi:hypothetical protein
MGADRSAKEASAPPEDSLAAPHAVKRVLRKKKDNVLAAAPTPSAAQGHASAAVILVLFCDDPYLSSP